MAIVDTSALVALMDSSDSHHDRARSELATHAVWHVTGGVMVELVRALRHRARVAGQDPDQTARRAVAMLRAMGPMRPAEWFNEPFVSRIFDVDARLSYADAWGISLAIERSEPLVTFDRAQADALRTMS